jgi:hypothetical protein
MKTLTIDQFKTRQLKNGESYVMVCDIGQPLTVGDRQEIIRQITEQEGADRFKIEDEWADTNHRYYLQLKITRNPIFGLVILLILAGVTVYVIGRSLTDVVKEVVVLTQKSVPLALIGLAGIIVIVVWKWRRQRRT